MKLDDFTILGSADLAKMDKEGTLHGIFRVSDADYHAGPGISSSQAVVALRSPAHFLAHVLKKKEEKTAAMRFGTMVHEYILQAEVFSQKYLAEPTLDGPKTKNPWKKEWDEFKAKCESESKTAITHEELERIQGIHSSVRFHQAAKDLLNNGLYELAAYATDCNGLVRKAKADILTKFGIIADLKTTQDASQSDFAKSIVNYEYHTKAAWYLRVFNAVLNEDQKIDSFVWIAVEKEPPYAVSVLAASIDMLTAGDENCEMIDAIIQKGMQNDEWPCYSSRIEAVELPTFYKRRAL